MATTLVLGCALAEPPPRPPCNARNQGMMWPEARPRDACTEVQVCTRQVWRYRWQPATVDVSRLAKGARHGSVWAAASAAARPAR